METYECQFKQCFDINKEIWNCVEKGDRQYGQSNTNIGVFNLDIVK